LSEWGDILNFTGPQRCAKKEAEKKTFNDVADRSRGAGTIAQTAAERKIRTKFYCCCRRISAAAVGATIDDEW